MSAASTRALVVELICRLGVGPVLQAFRLSAGTTARELAQWADAMDRGCRMSSIPPDDVHDPAWDAPLTDAQWRVAKYMFEDRTDDE